MKKIGIAAFLIIGLGAVAYLGYRFLLPKEEADPFSIIPDDAAVVFESSQLYSSIDRVKASKSWKNLEKLGMVSAFTQQLSFLDSLMNKETQRSFLENKKLVASFHFKSSNMGWILYIPMGNGQEASTILDGMNEKGFSLEKHSFGNHEILSIKSPGKTFSFSCFTYKNLLIASSGAVFAEDAIRVINQKKEKPFWKKEEVSSKDFFEGEVRVYLNYKNLTAVLGAVSDHELLNRLKTFARESILEFTFNDKEIGFNGYTFTSPKETSYLNVFKGQAPQGFMVRNYVPNTTSSVFYTGFSNSEKFQKDLYRFWEQYDAELLTRIDSVNRTHKIFLDRFYLDFGKEVAYCIVNGDKGGSAKYLFIHTEDPEKIYNRFKTSFSGNASVISFNGKSLATGEIPIKEFPQLLLGRMFSGFDKSFYFVLDNYLVIADSRDNIEKLQRAVDNEEVWGKTLFMSSFLEQSVFDFNLGLFVNLQLSDEFLSQQSVADSSHISINGLDAFDFLAVQFADAGETFLTNIQLMHHLSDMRIESTQSSTKDIQLNAPVTTIFVLNAFNGPKDLLIQDSAKTIYCLSHEREVKWSYALESDINGEVYVADMDKDKNPEVVFAAGNAIYALNEEGKQIESFPIRLPDTVAIKNISLIDYNGNKDYRIVASNREGKIYLFNLKGMNLEGWTPLSLKGSLADKVKHIRVNNKDIMVAVEEDGTVNAFNRKGEVYGKFPVALGSNVVSGVYVARGNSFKDTYLCFMTEGNQYVRVNLEGEVVSKLLNHPARILNESKGGSFLIASLENQKVQILDPDLKRRTTLPTASLAMHYYNFPSTGDVFLSQDDSGKSYTVYDKKGNILSRGVLLQGQRSALQYLDRKKVFRMVISEGNKLIEAEFNR